MKKLLLITFIAASVSALHARQLTPGEALNRTTGMSATHSRGVEARLVYTDVDAATGENGVYVFACGDDNGFLVVSADDCAEPLLGYSDSGTFDPDNMPDNLRAWLSSYTSQIAYASANASASLPAMSDNRPYRESISPLCKTLWNQGFPFNNLCPTDDNGAHCATGCVATAMAQVLKYHNWPDRGVGTHTYTCKSLNRELSFDFGNTVFEWDRMQDMYTSTNSSNMMNNLAVATLMYACGVAANMDYSSGGSGADVKTALNGMIDHLKIDKGVCIQQRKWYNINEWEELLYNNLIDYGPIMYYGASDAYSAHEFVCDGYSRDGFFHINWGWGGMSDGYFLLTALDPANQGIGGSSGGFNLWQNAVVGICPAKEDSQYAQIMSSGSNLKGNVANKTLTVSGSFFNESLVAIDGVVLGVKIGDEFYPGTQLSNPLDAGRGVWQYAVDLAALPEGAYRVYPAFRTADSDWQTMKCATTNVNFFDITVSADGNITIKNYNATISLSTSNLNLNTPLSPGKRFELTATIENKGIQEFYGEIAVLLQGNNGLNTVATQLIDLIPDSKEDIIVNQILPSDIPTGIYTLTIARVNGSQVVATNGQSIRVEVVDSEMPQFSIVSKSIDNDTSVDPENITVNIVMNNTGGYYYGPFRAHIFRNGASVHSFDSPMYMVEGGAKDFHLTFSGSLPSAEPHIKYSIWIYYMTGDRVPYIDNSNLYFTVEEKSAIENISPDTDVRAIEIYTANGLHIATPPTVTDVESFTTSDLPSGLYILRLTYNNGQKSTVKYLKK